MVEGCS